ncbi:unnamed protein product [Brassicogethes aeneus]|uniref:KASH domain-containing protein n=1 Tax=Brassicogethes aeneus TaxID=1431903 RepID=A0A9P0FNX7_BRAAE|nr:unnamed protein product [Brassicogethes aeneus]
MNNPSKQASDNGRKSSTKTWNDNSTAPNSGIYYFIHEDTEESQVEEMPSDVGSSLDTGYEMPKRKAVSEDTIRRLVHQAEQLVTPDIAFRKNHKSKIRIAANDEDSCDASGEDDQESLISDYDDSTATLKGLNDSQMTENGLGSEEKIKSWNTSLNQACSTPQRFNNLSMSESALHNMHYPHKYFNGTEVSNSTSSTVEEVGPHYLENPSPNRRKKRKNKTMFGKSDPYLTNCSPRQKSMLLKSCSFSGFSNKHNANESSSCSEPVIIMPNICDTSTTSGGESEEEMYKRRAGSFKVGLRTHYFNNEARDYSPGKSSLNMEEQSSSLSEAWDNYQENYLSEPYSESRDSDGARRLLNFGEDYRNFIDSPSDWSAFSDVSPVFKRKQRTPRKPYDDDFSLKQFLSDSKNQYKLSEELFNSHNLDNHFVTSEIDDLFSNCDRHIALINRIFETPEAHKISLIEQKKMTDLLQQWRLLKNNIQKMQEYATLQKKISETKILIKKLQVPEYLNFNSTPLDHIKNEIDVCKNLLKVIDLYSEKLTGINVDVHRFSLANHDLDSLNSKLKANVLDLYELLDSAKTLSTEKLEQMGNLLPKWQSLESRLEQFRMDLMDDEKNIDALISSLNDGIFTDQTATGVRDIAKLLSESTYHQGHHLGDFLTEGSVSDSGISDEGSEHEIGERQGRLSAIRRLVRQFEASLPSDSVSKIKIRETINKIEDDLKTLQSKCRSLVARTSACSSSNLSLQQKEAILKSLMKGEDPPSNSDKRPKWYNSRSFKASLVFQAIILTFVCLTYFFDPQCCDHMNNYKWSFSPKLHFEGRPPV